MSHSSFKAGKHGNRRKGGRHYRGHRQGTHPSHGPGTVRWFSDNLVLERIDTRTPGIGLPQAAADRRAGTHSGFVTTIRAVDANDAYLPGGGLLLQYEGTYRLNAVAANPPPGLREGQITARGVLLRKNGDVVGGRLFAITGGTDAYATARGHVSEETKDRQEFRSLDIVL